MCGSTGYTGSNLSPFAQINWFMRKVTLCDNGVHEYWMAALSIILMAALETRWLVPWMPWHSAKVFAYLLMGSFVTSNAIYRHVFSTWHTMENACYMSWRYVFAHFFVHFSLLTCVCARLSSRWPSSRNVNKWSTHLFTRRNKLLSGLSSVSFHCFPLKLTGKRGDRRSGDRKLENVFRMRKSKLLTRQQLKQSMKKWKTLHRTKL